MRPMGGGPGHGGDNIASTLDSIASFLEDMAADSSSDSEAEPHPRRPPPLATGKLAARTRQPSLAMDKPKAQTRHSSLRLRRHIATPLPLPKSKGRQRLQQPEEEKEEPVASRSELPLDADEFFQARETARFAAMISSGSHTPQQVEDIKARKQHQEEAHVCRHMIKARAWTTDSSLQRADVYMCYASALDGLKRRDDAIRVLEAAVEEDGSESASAALKLALAKLLFKAERKQESLALCTAVQDSYRGGGVCYSTQDAADAYQLAGWVMIHGDNHSATYKTWSAGHRAIPSCEFLARQHRKRQIWDRARAPPGAECTGLVGRGAHGDGIFDAARDLDAYSVHPSQIDQTPALALFDRRHQQDRVVFRSRNALLTPNECARVLEKVDEFHTDKRGGKWGTVRASTVKTTDVAVEDIPALRPWLRELLHSRLYPMIAAAFPMLSDGSTTNDGTESRMRVHDAFIVRYAKSDGSLSLPEHSDTSSMSFTLALNEQTHYQGGGTWFEALGPTGQVVDAGIGRAIAFAGPLRHAGFPISEGTRTILVLFLYVEKFSYGDALQKEKNRVQASRPVIPPSLTRRRATTKFKGFRPNGFEVHYPSLPSAVTQSADGEYEMEDESREEYRKPSGDRVGGFVVYRQTKELVEMLNKQVKSVLE